jgi:hypothetical protein
MGLIARSGLRGSLGRFRILRLALSGHAPACLRMSGLGGKADLVPAMP